MQTIAAMHRHFRAFAHTHDELPAFHAAFLVCTFIAAALLNLGSFGLLIIAHMALDYVKYRDVHHFGLARTIHAMLVESLIDITLFFVAFSSLLYLHHGLALVSLSGLQRASIALARAATTIVPKMEILVHFLYILGGMDYYLRVVHPTIAMKRFGTTEKLCLVFLCISIMLVAVAPVRFADSRDDLARLVIHELTPGLE